jgi:hypothetical protein
MMEWIALENVAYDYPSRKPVCINCAAITYLKESFPAFLSKLSPFSTFKLSGSTASKSTFSRSLFLHRSVDKSDPQASIPAKPSLSVRVPANR